MDDREPTRRPEDEELVVVPPVPATEHAVVRAGAGGVLGALAGALLGALIGTILWLAGVAVVPAYIASIVVGAAAGGVFGGMGSGLTAMQEDAQAEGWEGPDGGEHTHRRAYGA